MGLAWSAGAILEDRDVLIPAADLALEHGLGLFESFRTWGGRAPLLDRHLARMTRSATDLSLPLDPASLPGGDAVSALLSACRIDGDARLRLTMSGGDPARVWLTAAPLPPAAPDGGITLAMVPWAVSASDPLARHKTLNYWSKRLAAEAAARLGAGEGLLATEDGRIWEGTRSNVWIRRGSTWITPGLDGPVLPGVFRAWMFENAGRIHRVAIQADLRLEHLLAADEVAVSNSVRGLVPVGVVAGEVVPARAEGFPGVRLWDEAFREWVEERKGQR